MVCSLSIQYDLFCEHPILVPKRLVVGDQRIRGIPKKCEQNIYKGFELSQKILPKITTGEF